MYLPLKASIFLVFFFIILLLGASDILYKIYMREKEREREIDR